MNPVNAVHKVESKATSLNGVVYHYWVAICGAVLIAGNGSVHDENVTCVDCKAATQ